MNIYVMFYFLAVITDSMLCASVLGKKDACTFDSGGPLVYQKQVCGIVSFDWDVPVLDMQVSTRMWYMLSLSSKKP